MLSSSDIEISRDFVLGADLAHFRLLALVYSHSQLKPPLGKSEVIPVKERGMGALLRWLRKPPFDNS